MARGLEASLSLPAKGLPEPYYEDEAVTLYCGDAREVMAQISAEVMLTDPPYGMKYDSGWWSRRIAGDKDTAVRDEVLQLWGDGPALVFGRWDQPHPANTRMVLTWDKGDWPGMGDLSLPWGPSTEEIYVLGKGFAGSRSGSVIRYPRLPGSSLHPNEKPVGLLKQLAMKCPAGTLVDPFAGSGSTLRAAKDLGRSAVGVELSEEYCELTAKRLAQGVLPLETA